MDLKRFLIRTVSANVITGATLRIAIGGLQPQNEMTLPIRLLSTSGLTARESKLGWTRSYVVIGILKASYEGGGEFVYDTAPHHGFDPTPIELGSPTDRTVQPKKSPRTAEPYPGAQPAS